MKIILITVAICLSCVSLSMGIVVFVRNMRDIKDCECKVQITEKGYAVIIAIESGLLPRVVGGWDDTAFNKFWDAYSANLTKRIPEVKKLLKL